MRMSLVSPPVNTTTPAIQSVLRSVLPRSSTLSTLTPRSAPPSAPPSAPRPTHLPSNLYSWLLGASHWITAPWSAFSRITASGSEPRPEATPGMAHARFALRFVSPSRLAVSTKPTPARSEDWTHTTSAGSSWLLRTSAISPTRRSFHRIVSSVVVRAPPPRGGFFGRRIRTHGVALTAASERCLK